MKIEQMHMDDFVGRQLASDSGPFLLWVNSDEVSFHPVELPAVPASKLQKMLPWLVEDQLLEAPDRMHLVKGLSDQQSDHLIAVSRESMNGWMTLMGDVAGRVKCLLPDVLALPYSPGCISLTRRGDRWLVRNGLCDGFSGSVSYVAARLNAMMKKDAAIQLHLYGCSADELSLDAPGQQIHGREQPIDWSSAEAPNINLLAGSYRKIATGFNAGRWWPAIAAGLCALSLGFAFVAIDHRLAGRELAEVNAALAQDYQSLFAEAVPSLQSLRRSAEIRLRLREQRYLAEQLSILPLIQDLDPALSGCRDCLLSAMQLTPDGASLTLNRDADALVTLQGLIGWSSQRENLPEDRVLVTLERNSR